MAFQIFRNKKTYMMSKYCIRLQSSSQLQGLDCNRLRHNEFLFPHNTLTTRISHISLCVMLLNWNTCVFSSFHARWKITNMYLLPVYCHLWHSHSSDRRVYKTAENRKGVSWRLSWSTEIGCLCFCASKVLTPALYGSIYKALLALKYYIRN